MKIKTKTIQVHVQEEHWMKLKKLCKDRAVYISNVSDQIFQDAVVEYLKKEEKGERNNRKNKSV